MHFVIKFLYEICILTCLTFGPFWPVQPEARQGQGQVRNFPSPFRPGLFWPGPFSPKPARVSPKPLGPARLTALLGLCLHGGRKQPFVGQLQWRESLWLSMHACHATSLYLLFFFFISLLYDFHFTHFWISNFIKNKKKDK